MQKKSKKWLKKRKMKTKPAPPPKLDRQFPFAYNHFEAAVSG
jgi:hypothetical protein